MAAGIQLQPLPPEMTRVVDISCIDCGAQDKDRRWHFLGIQCGECSSFNTIVNTTVLVGREAAEYLGDECCYQNAACDEWLRNGFENDEETSTENSMMRTVEDSISSFADDSEGRIYDRLLMSLRTSVETSAARFDQSSADNQNDSP
jgi:Zinc-ribbon